MNIAGVLSDQGKLVEAEEFYKKAFTLEPQNADAHNNYGVFLGKMGQTRKALEKYKTALKLNPSHSVALVNMARQLRASGNIHDAEKTYKRFVYLLPQNPGLSHLGDWGLTRLWRTVFLQSMFCPTIVRLNDPDNPC